MMNEPSFAPREYGWIEVVCGGMFSGKTEELIRRAKRAHIAGQNVVIVKPAIDKRYSDTEVIIAGLDMDFEGKPFGPMPYLLAIAEYVTKLHAVCSESGTMANFSQRVVEDTNKVLVGEYDAYEPRARHCYRPSVDKRRGKPIRPFKNPEQQQSLAENPNIEHT